MAALHHRTARVGIGTSFLIGSYLSGCSSVTIVPPAEPLSNNQVTLNVKYDPSAKPAPLSKDDYSLFVSDCINSQLQDIHRLSYRLDDKGWKFEGGRRVQMVLRQRSSNLEELNKNLIYLDKRLEEITQGSVPTSTLAFETNESVLRGINHIPDSDLTSSPQYTMFCAVARRWEEENFAIERDGTTVLDRVMSKIQALNEPVILRDENKITCIGVEDKVNAFVQEKWH